MTVQNLPPNSPEKLAQTGQAAFDTRGETVDLHRSDLPAFTPDEYLSIAMELAHSANEFNKAAPNDIDTLRIEQQQTAATYGSAALRTASVTEKVANAPFNPVEYPNAVGANLATLRENAMKSDWDLAA